MPCRPSWPPPRPRRSPDASSSACRSPPARWAQAPDPFAAGSPRSRWPPPTAEASLVDGPFSEAKEMVGGYFIVDVATRDEAVAIARDVPAAQWATVEVREFGPCFM